MTNYNLELQSPYEGFDPQAVLSDPHNRLTLQAALTSMLQKNSGTSGSVIELHSIANRRRRQTSNSSDITFNLNITNNKPCSTACLNQYHSLIINLLSNNNHTTSSVRYQPSNLTTVYWLYYRLPKKIQSSSRVFLVISNSEFAFSCRCISCQCRSEIHYISIGSINVGRSK